MRLGKVAVRGVRSGVQWEVECGEPEGFGQAPPITFYHTGGSRHGKLHDFENMLQALSCGDQLLKWVVQDFGDDFPDRRAVDCRIEGPHLLNDSSGKARANTYRQVCLELILARRISL
jgi:hypothetical protein